MPEPILYCLIVPYFGSPYLIPLSEIKTRFDASKMRFAASFGTRRVTYDGETWVEVEKV